MYVKGEVFFDPWKENMVLNSIYNSDMVKVLDNRRPQPQRQEKQPVVPHHEGPMPDIL